MAARWSKPSAVPGVTTLRAVSCTSRSFCAAVGGEQAVVYASGRWRGPHTIDSHSTFREGLRTVSCTSAMFCVAGDGAGNTFAYDGTSWSAPTLMATAGLSELSCAGRRFCAALDDNAHALFYDGSSWSKPKVIRGAFQPQFISCPSVGFCMAMDTNEGYRLSAGHWASTGFISTSEPSGGSEPDEASAVSCSGPHFCAALDDFGDAFTWRAGRGWSARHRFDRSLTDGSDAVSCPTKVACTAVDASGFTTRWNGTAWSRKRQIDHPGLADVSCPTPQFCLAVDFRERAVLYQ
jgi:hypothetical protein